MSLLIVFLSPFHQIEDTSLPGTFKTYFLGLSSAGAGVMPTLLFTIFYPSHEILEIKQDERGWYISSKETK